MFKIALIINYTIDSSECVNYVRLAEKTVTMFFKVGINLGIVTLSQRVSFNGLC